MRAADADIVRSLPLFSGMQPANFAELIEAGYLNHIPPGVILAHEGERPDFLHVLVRGGIEFYSTKGGRETTLSLMLSHGAFILAAVVLDQLYLKSARTLQGSVIVLIPAAAVRGIFNKDAAFSRAVVAELAARYRGLVKDLKNQRLRTSLERLANWIIAQNELLGRPGSFRLPTEKKALANLLGMRPENLSRSFADLAELGVEVDGAKITIVKEKLLVDFANPDPLIDDPST
ncbi:MAG: helix-turn-helix domain-containing protein [Hyphomicrobiaceae bacterium]|nr:MAG: helix-turn-helix domain-containing protein [Hyphomicrobiaceae bacterium]